MCNISSIKVNFIILNHYVYQFTIKKKSIHSQSLWQNKIALDSAMYLWLIWAVHQVKKLEVQLLQIEDENLCLLQNCKFQ